MKRVPAMLVLLALLCPGRAGAHLGSQDVFYEGLAGPYPVSVTIRMPGVVPGLAEITAEVRTGEPVTVAFAPISSQVAVSNAPPPEPGQLVPGETNLFTGQLWLMTSGAYSIDVRVGGKSGEGAVQIPVNSVATRQLPLPSWLGAVLVALGLILICSGIAIVAAAAGESIFPPEEWLNRTARRRYWMAAAITAAIAILALVGGRRWWKLDEADFRSRLRDAGWPDLTTTVRIKDAQRILRLDLGEADLKRDERLKLVPDHGKLLHVFLVRLPRHDAFAHIHPVRSGDKTFDVAVPPLPEGDYEVLCDLTLEHSGFSSTATNIVHLPAVPAQTLAANSFKSDPDDSWVADATVAAHDNGASDTTCRLPDGTQLIWKAHPVLRARQDAGLRFEARGADGKPVALEPYMGMTSHAAVLRADGQVFAHLHPSGNYSMAAQFFFDSKIGQETGAAIPGHGHGGVESVCGGPGNTGAAASSLLSLPYQFPTAGDYRLWVQIKTGGRVQTAIFDATVQPAPL